MGSERAKKFETGDPDATRRSKKRPAAEPAPDVPAPLAAQVETAQTETMNIRPGWEGETIFHSDWWLDAVAPGQWRRLEVTQGGGIVGVLPIWETSKWGLKLSVMPPFTHVLGPAIEVGLFSPIGQLHRRFKITTELLAKVPKNHFFRQALDASVPDVFAFQAAGYSVAPHYTILIDCQDINRIWNSLEKKTRWVIRRAGEKFQVNTLNDPEQFADFYIHNLMGRKLSSRLDMNHFVSLYQACKAHNSGESFAVRGQNGALLAAIYVVWGCGRMYYLMSTRDRSIPDVSAGSLLVWHAIQQAHARSLILDLDGVISKSVFHFLSGFGGLIKPRMIVQKQAHWFEIANTARRWLRGGDEETFV